MLQPKKTKFRRQQKGRMKGNAHRGTELSFGSFGIKTLESAWLTGQQIEAARQAVVRYMKREGKIWIRVFPDKPYTKKPAEVRMGKGKGNPEGFVAPITPGRMLIEAEGVPLEVAKEALRLGAQKLPVTTKEIREMSIKDLRERIETEKANLAQMKLNHAVSPIEDTSKIRKAGKDIARMLTILTEKENQAKAE